MSRTADKYAEEKRQLEERVKAVEEQVKAFAAESAKAGAAADAKATTYSVALFEIELTAAKAPGDYAIVNRRPNRTELRIWVWTATMRL
jgi:hypothetical protein